MIMMIMTIMMTMALQMLIEEEDPSLLNAFRQSNQIAVEVTTGDNDDVKDDYEYFDDHDGNLSYSIDVTKHSVR